MRQLQSITRTLPLPITRPSNRVATATLLTLSNHHQYSTATQTTRPKPLDGAGKYEGNSRDVERGEGSEGKAKKPGPKIHNTAGVFDGEKRDVERHNREFRERHEREK
ncbi:hypothetical protein TWF281_003420 [Arthrobotrys megalospora]